jgi:hypothetical protein
MGKDFLKDKISKKMKDQIEKIVEYSGNGKRVFENLKTKVSSHNDNRWPKGLALGEPFKKVVVRSEIRAEPRDLQPSICQHKKLVAVREKKKGS